MRLPDKKAIIALTGLLIAIAAGGLFVYAESANNVTPYVAVSSTPVGPTIYSVANDNSSVTHTPWPSPPPNVTTSITGSYDVDGDYVVKVTPNSNGSYTVTEGNQTFIESYYDVVMYELTIGIISKPPGATIVTGNGSYNNTLVPRDPLGLPPVPGVTEPENWINATIN